MTKVKVYCRDCKKMNTVPGCTEKFYVHPGMAWNYDNACPFYRPTIWKRFTNWIRRPQ
jgi:hypothetical protein